MDMHYFALWECLLLFTCSLSLASSFIPESLNDNLRVYSFTKDNWAQYEHPQGTSHRTIFKQRARLYCLLEAFSDAIAEIDSEAFTSALARYSEMIGFCTRFHLVIEILMKLEHNLPEDETERLISFLELLESHAVPDEPTEWVFSHIERLVERITIASRQLRYKSQTGVSERLDAFAKQEIDMVYNISNALREGQFDYALELAGRGNALKEFGLPEFEALLDSPIPYPEKRMEFLEELVSHGLFDVNKVLDQNGNTPILIALKYRGFALDIIGKLVLLNASRHYKNERGKDAYSMPVGFANARYHACVRAIIKSTPKTNIENIIADYFRNDYRWSPVLPDPVN